MAFALPCKALVLETKTMCRETNYKSKRFVPRKAKNVPHNSRPFCRNGIVT